MNKASEWLEARGQLGNLEFRGDAVTVRLKTSTQIILTERDGMGKVALTHREALRLGKWLVETFGNA